MSKETPSRVLLSVLAEMRSREEHGLRKYGTTLDRTDLSLMQMLQHAKEEAMDFVMYIERAMRMLAALEHAQHCGQPELLPALTADEVNTLPEKVRRYVMWLETNADPAHATQQNFRLTVENEGLRQLIAEANRRPE